MLKDFTIFSDKLLNAYRQYNFIGQLYFGAFGMCKTFIVSFLQSLILSKILTRLCKMELIRNFKNKIDNMDLLFPVFYSIFITPETRPLSSFLYPDYD